MCQKFHENNKFCVLLDEIMKVRWPLCFIIAILCHYTVLQTNNSSRNLKTADVENAGAQCCFALRHTLLPTAVCTLHASWTYTFVLLCIKILLADNTRF